MASRAPLAGRKCVRHQVATGGVTVARTVPTAAQATEPARGRDERLAGLQMARGAPETHSSRPCFTWTAAGSVQGVNGDYMAGEGATVGATRHRVAPVTRARAGVRTICPFSCTTIPNRYGSNGGPLSPRCAVRRVDHFDTRYGSPGDLERPGLHEVPRQEGRGRSGADVCGPGARRRLGPSRCLTPAPARSLPVRWHARAVGQSTAVDAFRSARLVGPDRVGREPPAARCWRRCGSASAVAGW